ncbi:NYN domain-containing protein [Peptostreptococcaceae bacterium AGR-M142]
MGKLKKEYLVVDGYNIINFLSQTKALYKENLELARNKLVDILAEYKGYTGIEVIIVFDAYKVKQNIGKEYNEQGIKIIFTKERETADHYIEKLVSDLPKNSIIRVATNDFVEQQMILGKGSVRVSARELEFELEKSNRKIKKETNKISKRNTLESYLDEDVLNKLKNMFKDE